VDAARVIHDELPFWRGSGYQVPASNILRANTGELMPANKKQAGQSQLPLL